jgi:hypothetical protein
MINLIYDLEKNYLFIQKNNCKRIIIEAQKNINIFKL